jgi:hypothetical protein
MTPSIAVAAVVSATLAGGSLLNARQTPPGGAACAATIQSSAGDAYGNRLLSVAGLWPDGTIVFKLGGPGFVTSDGSLGMKFLWTRSVRGKLSVAGRRLDGATVPLRLEANSAYGDIGIQPSYLIFATPGCWEITAQIDEREDSKMSFVTKVVKIGNGPTWRRDPPRN